MKVSFTEARLIGFLAGGIALCAGTAASATVINFEGLLTNQSVNGQGGWTVEDEFGSNPTPFDEQVVDDGTGNTVWRASNAIATSSFSNQPHSHTTSAAGETGSALWNDRGPNSAAPLSPPNPGAFASTNTFHGGFKFKSATGAAQSDLSIDISASAKQSTFRNSFIRIADDGANGFDVSAFDTGPSATPFGAGSNFPEIASDLGYSDWHTIDIFIEFVDGLNGDTTGNDVVRILLNGTVIHTGSTWESFYVGANPANLNIGDQPQLQAVDSLMFRLGSAAPGTESNGFFFDDVVIDNAAFSQAVPEPATLVLFGLGLAGLGFARRRKAT